MASLVAPTRVLINIDELAAAHFRPITAIKCRPGGAIVL
jgi:hypothetical protein